jgi:hypothetical protein
MQYSSAYPAVRPHSGASIWSELVDAMPIVIFARGLREVWKDRQRARLGGAADQPRQDTGRPRSAN